VTNSSDAGSGPPELERVPCGLCGGPRYRRYARKFDLDLVKCRDCGLVYANPRLVEAEVLKRYNPDYFYGEYLPTFNAGPTSFDMELIRKHYALFLRILSRSRAPGRRLLDVGCGAGFFLKAAQEAGWDAEGVEVSAAAAAYGNEVLGVKVRNAKLEQGGFPPETFDVITLLDTIEHLPHPLASLTEVRRLLKRNGLLLLNTPDLRSLSRLFLGKAWAVLSPAEHLYNFTAGTLGRLIAKAGFEVVAVENLLAFNPEYTHKPTGFRAER
jgi:2-polyprenyl-3-methyl-5-hydroxy-6-metoxy-1,4-benzoquinol methylase